MDNKKLMLNYVFCCSFFFFKNLKYQEIKGLKKKIKRIIK